MYYVVGYFLGMYVVGYLVNLFINPDRVDMDHEGNAVLAVSSLLWPLTIVLSVIAVGYVVIKKHISKAFVPMDFVVNTSVYAYKKSLEYIETKYISYKRKGYKPYVQANNNRSNVQSNVR